MRFAAVLGSFAVLLVLSACNGQGGDPLGLISNQGGDAGLADYAITGGADNAVLGVDPKSVIGGKMAGFLDADDQGAAAMATARAAGLAHGQKVTWQRTVDASRTTAAGFASAIGAPFQDSGGRTCRFVQESATRGSDSLSDAVRICNGPSGWVPA